MTLVWPVVAEQSVAEVPAWFLAIAISASVVMKIQRKSAESSSMLGDRPNDHSTRSRSMLHLQALLVASLDTTMHFFVESTPVSD